MPARAAVPARRSVTCRLVLRVIADVGLVKDGLFAQDPPDEDPPGARAVAPTVHEQLPTLFSVITVTGLTSGRGHGGPAGKAA